MNVQVVVIIQAMKAKKVKIKDVWKKTDKERDAYYTCYYGIK